MRRVYWVAILAIALGGCSGADDDKSASTVSPPSNPPAETADRNAPSRPADLQPGAPGGVTPPVDATGRDRQPPVTSGGSNRNDERDAGGAGRANPPAVPPSETPPPADEPDINPGDRGGPTSLVAAFPSTNGTVGLKSGDLIPEIAGVDVEGSEFKLSDYEGKVIMLDFWGDW